MKVEDKLQRLTEMKEARCTPDQITSLDANEVFVFGTDPEGKHRSNAAKLAVKKFGAKYGLAYGISGQSFAIPVHRFRRKKMVEAVDGFIKFARENGELRFYVLPVGCGAAGMDPAFVALMFRNAIDLPNVWLSKLFINELIQYYTIGVEISEDGKTIIRFPMDWEGKYRVPYGIEVIGDDSFCGCRCELELPESITRIGKYAFSDMCQSVCLPRSVSSIDEEAFESEYFGPKILVYYDSYAYRWAKTNELHVTCVDFDESADTKRRLDEASCVRSENDDGTVMYYSVDNPSYAQEDIVIGRYWVFVRTADGRMRFVCGKAEDVFILEVCSWKNVVSAAAGFNGVFAVLESGKVVWAANRKHKCGSNWCKTCKYNLANMFNRLHKAKSMYQISSICENINDECRYNWCRKLDQWHGVKKIVACEGRVAGLTGDGKVLSISDQSGYERPADYDGELMEQGKFALGVKHLAVGWLHAAVLDSSGNVKVVGDGSFCNAGNVKEWRNVVDVDVFSSYYTQTQTVGLCSDGRVMHTLNCPEVDSWRGIVSVSCLGSLAIVALDGDGHILLAGEIGEQDCDTVKKWPQIVALRANFDTLVGISRNGTIRVLRE